MKEIVILGATGSIGTQTLDIIDAYPDMFRLIGATAYQSVEPLREVAEKHPLRYLAIATTAHAQFAHYTQCTLYDADALEALVEAVPKDAIIVNALVGSVGLRPTLTALKRGMTVLLANKETLVVGGPLIRPYLEAGHGRLVPIDSEHAALRHCLHGRALEDVDKVVITASGGSFRDTPQAKLATVTREDALSHPNWSMGAKITIDSATMMNKVFEIIEAHVLFGLPYDAIEAVLHRESIVHAFVHYRDGNILAHIGPADMRIPILSALQGESCLPYRSVFDITKIKTLTFEPIIEGRYPLFDLGIAVARTNGLHVVTMNAANEVAVQLFLEGRIEFLEIETAIKAALDAFPNERAHTLEAIETCDQAVRAFVTQRFQEGDSK